ncbi:unnamed protein product [Didymodactylos carnosus]|uniref:Uncharacterized protein n=1 Tax=Didymodactylos carnosus TaxID=1234261 RepID=A0A815GKV3_9BILA|nr:unnamed protein product [Didymodactylos carnosus]CAF4199495.1 unnamed protein product [Didymodactylos carnosus]
MRYCVTCKETIVTNLPAPLDISEVNHSILSTNLSAEPKNVPDITTSSFLISAEEADHVDPLNVYENNIRKADEPLLRAGNFSYVPTIDVIKTAIKEYRKKFRFDEGCYKEIRIARQSLFTSDTFSKIVIGVNALEVNSELTLKNL